MRGQAIARDAILAYAAAPSCPIIAPYTETRMLINCAAYQDGKKLGDIAPEDISKYVSRPECFVWVAMKDPRPSELASMQHEIYLHELAVRDERHRHQRPKIAEYRDS